MFRLRRKCNHEDRFTGTHNVLDSAPSHSRSQPNQSPISAPFEAYQVFNDELRDSGLQAMLNKYHLPHQTQILWATTSCSNTSLESPGGSLCYGTCAQEAGGTKAQEENGLVSGLKDQRFLPVTNRGDREVWCVPSTSNGSANVTLRCCAAYPSMLPFGFLLFGRATCLASPLNSDHFT